MLDINYVKSWAGILKITEFFCLLVAFSSLAHFSEKSENNGGFKFFLFVTITGWLIVMALFCLFMLIYSAVETFLLLVASSVVAEKARTYRRGAGPCKGNPNFVDTCDCFDKHGAPCSNVEASVVFGFFLVALFLADAVFYFMKHRSVQQETDGGFVQHEGGATTDYNPETGGEQIP